MPRSGISGAYVGAGGAAGLMQCYEMLKVLQAWPGPSKTCGLLGSAQLSGWDIGASPDAIAGPLGHLHVQGRAPLCPLQRGQWPSHPSTSSRCLFMKLHREFSGPNLRCSAESCPIPPSPLSLRAAVRCIRLLLAQGGSSSATPCQLAPAAPRDAPGSLGTR